MYYNVIGVVPSRIGLEVIDMAAIRLNLDTDNLVRLYQEGWSENRLAKHLGVSRPVIRRRLLESGVHIRSQSEAEALKWSLMTPEQRARQVEAAHKAARGRPKTIEEKLKLATTRYRLGHMSSYEVIFANMLGRLGLAVIPQAPCGPYNIDLAVGPIAVEIFGGGFHMSGRHLARAHERAKYLFDAGWHILAIWVDKRRYPLTIHAAEYLATWLKELRRDPPPIGQYRVIRGNGEPVALGSANDNHITFKPAFTNGRDPRTGRYIRVPR
jgi:very-short-patch-repair endonuclease